MGMLSCPVCGASVNAEDLERHTATWHPAPPPAVPRGARWAIVVVAVILAAVVILVAMYAVLRATPVGPGGGTGGGPHVGGAAANFMINTSTGGFVALASYRGAPTVLQLMDVDCTPCRAEASNLASVYRNYSARGVQFLSVSLIDWILPADTSQSVETFKMEQGTSWTYGMDVDHVVRNAYYPGSTGYGVPTAYILDRNGVITAILKGAQSGTAAYAQALDAVLGP